MKTYITKAGADTLREELLKLKNEERPKVVETVSWAASNGDRSENGDYLYGKKRLREIDRRIRYIIKKLEGAQIVDPETLSTDKVVFGLKVKVLHEDERELLYQIVGEDEIAVEEGKISWKSPLAKALIGKQVGDESLFRKPSGDEIIEILDIMK
ncbi:MAG: transcription elongation factor GreB [Bdellovibrionota bacterium]|nr:transcription elongation factor GreB [Pseudobdellovibrionaceae bacterium]